MRTNIFIEARSSITVDGCLYPFYIVSYTGTVKFLHKSCLRDTGLTHKLIGSNNLVAFNFHPQSDAAGILALNQLNMQVRSESSDLRFGDG